MEEENAYEFRRTLRLEADGDSRTADLVIGFPKNPTPNEPAYCLCSCDPLIKNNTKIFGEDQLHALTLCLWFCVQEFKRQEKYQVIWTEEGDVAGLGCISRP
jgi:hypothetical protein